MTITFPCEFCAYRNTESLEIAGHFIPCKRCRREISVPFPRKAPVTPTDPAGQPDRPIRFVCNECGQAQQVGPERAGQKVACSRCATALTVPAGRKSVPSAARARPPGGPDDALPMDESEEDAGTGYDLGTLPDEPSPFEPIARRGGEPERRVVLPRLVYQPTPEEREARFNERHANRKKPKKKSNSIGLQPREAALFLTFVAGTSAFSGILGYVHPEMRQILAILLILAGGILTVVGYLGFASVAREEGDLYGLLCKFVPFYNFYFLVTRWTRMREHVLFYIAGLVLLLPGTVLMKTAPPIEMTQKKKHDPWAEMREKAGHRRENLAGTKK